MKQLLVVITLAGIIFFAGCQQVTKEKHSSTNLQQDVSSEQAVQEAATMDQTPKKIDSGPMEVHKETIVEQVESEEVVIE